MTFFALAALVNTVCCTLLGLFVYAKNKQSAVNRTFLYYTLAIMLWSLSYFFWQIAPASNSALFWCKALTAGSTLIPVCYTHFVYEVIEKKKQRGLFRLIDVLTIILLVLVPTNLMVARVEPRNVFPYWPVAGQAYIFYLVFFFGLVGYSTYLITVHHAQTKGQKRIQLLYFLIASVIGYVGGATNYPLWYNIPIAPWGNILVTFFALVLAYSVIRYRALNVKIMQTEALVLFISMALTVDIIISTNTVYAIIRTCLLVGFGVLGMRLVRTTSKIEKMNNRLEKDKKELVQLDRMKDEFLQMATHELNTPITVIEGRLNMAIEEDFCNLNEEQKKFLQPVLDDTERLARLSKDILDVARIDQKRLVINRSEVNVSDLISQIIADMQLRAKEKNNTITFESDDPALVLNLDQSKISEVITNLLTNANKFTTSGTITARLEKQDDNAIISVQDTGIGLNAEDQKHLFQKFYQAGRFDPKHPQEQQGSGLGLYISKNIVTLHGGSMWVQSQKDKGSTFYFSLPIKYNESNKELQPEESNLQAVEA